MKNIGVISLITILLLFGAPLLNVKDKYKNMEYEEIGNVMLNNVDTYIDSLKIASEAGSALTEVGDKLLSAVSVISEVCLKIQEYTYKGFNSVVEFVKNIFEHESGQVCDGSAEEGWTCGSSNGGGGGSFGGN